MLTFTTALVLLLTNPFKCNSLSLFNSSSNTRTTTSSASSAVDFIGKSSSQIILPILLLSDSQQMSFPRWLSSKDSHHHLLGTKSVSLRDDGTYHCHLPSLSFFGLNIKPICTSTVEVDYDDQNIVSNNFDMIEISNHSSITQIHPNFVDASQIHNSVVDAKDEGISLKVTIQDSILQVDSSSESIGNVLSSLMEMCKLRGGNKIKCVRNNNTWVLSSDLELQLNLFLGSHSNGQPKLLPPGFRSIGERILKKTCEKRVEENLNSIKAGFEEYLMQTQQSDSAL